MRLYRIVEHDEDDEPWIVQGDAGHNKWVDVARFTDRDDGRHYILEVQTRQQKLEATR